jgi:cell division protease FtsH
MDRAELIRRMTVLLGGRASERLVFEEVSTGAADDLAKASEIARNMVVRFGMDPKLGQAVYETDPAPLLGVPAGADWRPRHYGEQTADAIDGAVRELVENAFQRATAVLVTNRAVLERAATELLAKETLSGEQLKELVRDLSVGPVAKAVA